MKKAKIIMRKQQKIYIKIIKIKNCHKIFNFKMRIIIFNNKNQRSYQNYIIFKT